MQRVIVAFTGKRGHGKTTAAEALESIGFRHINFADSLKAAAAIVFGLSHEEMLDALLKEKVLERWPHKSPRELLQVLGTDLLREYLPETWTQAFNRDVAGYSHIVCSDLRFPNEEAYLRALPADQARTMVLRVVDPRKPQEDEASRHASEVQMDNIVADFTIQNAGSVADLHAAVRKVVGF